MATLAKCVLKTPIAVVESGAPPHTYTSTYEVHINQTAGTGEWTDGNEVLELARNAAVPPNNRLPYKGMPMPTPYGLPPSNSKFVIDPNVYAMEFRARPRPGSWLCWEVEVTWRAPRVNSGEVNVDQLKYYVPPWSPHYKDDEDGDPIVDPDKPWSKDFEWWWEWVTRTDPKREGRLVTRGSNGSSDSIAEDETYFQATNGEILGSLPENVEVGVLVVEYSTSVHDEAVRLTDEYQNTVNGDTVKLLPMTMVDLPPQHMAFLLADQSKKHDRGWGGYVVQARWLIHKPPPTQTRLNPVSVRLDNVGSWVKNPETGFTTPRSIIYDGSQIPISPPYALDKDGFYAETDPLTGEQNGDFQPHVEYVVRKDATYGTEDWMETVPEAP